jgi:hypothetical protein
MKPLLCLDFDGVIHSYDSGWKGADQIPDPPVKGALQFIVKAMEHFRVAIFSSRSCQVGGMTAMREWLGYWSVDPDYGMGDQFDHGAWGAIEWPTEKPPAFLTIDDRAIMFNGQFPDPKLLLKFRPWNKTEELPYPRADSFKIWFCEGENCGAHTIAYNEIGAIICEIVMSPDQTRRAIETMLAGLMDKDNL